MRAHADRLIEVREAQPLFDNVFTTGEMGDIPIEQSLVLKTPKGLIVVTGCAHPRVVAIADQAKEMLGERILLVVGGYHLRAEDESRLLVIINDLRQRGCDTWGLAAVRGATPDGCFGANMGTVS